MKETNTKITNSPSFMLTRVKEAPKLQPKIIIFVPATYLGENISNILKLLSK